MNSVLSFFNVARPWDVTWAHRVNSRAALERYRGSPDVMMIEGDISRSAEMGRIIMAHPPRQESDLTFEGWVEEIARARKGAKLDFKDPSVVATCLEKLREMDCRDMPVFLNADVLKGPGGPDSRFEPGAFIAECNRLCPEGVLSIGWTTGHVEGGRYSVEMVNQMLRLRGRVRGPVTFPVRAYYVRDSWGELRRLIERPEDTLTLWNSEAVEEDLKAWLREEMDPGRTFYDLTDADGSPMRL